MRKGETVLDPLLPVHSLNWFLCGLFGSLLDVAGQHVPCRGIVRSYTWGEAHLLLSLCVPPPAGR